MNFCCTTGRTNLVLFVLLCNFINSSFGFLKFRRDYQSSSSFIFANLQNNSVNPLEPSINQVQTRQIVIGTIPKIVNPISQPVTCMCVPPGSCSTPLTPSPAIDIRIVNNLIPLPPTTTESVCNYGLTRCCHSGPYQCGIRYPSPPGSIPAAPGQSAFGEYPWQVALLKINEYLGSGALIDKRHVLTTAHKVYNITTDLLKIRLGEWNSVNTGEPIPAEDFGVQTIFLHNGFNKENLHNDIAILRLAMDVELTKKPTIGTVCLPNVPFFNQKCYVAGWGKETFGPNGAIQAVQRDVDVSLVSNAACVDALRRTRLGPNFILNDASFICAGGESGKDACTGDGGSPLVCENNGRWFVIGLVAWGIGCATGGVPGVYVNVAAYLPWIQSIINAY